MRPTEILSREHALVMLVTKVAEQEVRYMHDTGEYRHDEVHQVVDFFEFFTEACHDPKEEHILFARLAERGLDPEAGILGQLYREHADFTSSLHDIEHWLRRDRKEGPLEVAELADMLETYLHLMRAHVAREDDLLFTLANGLLTADDQEDLLRAFAAVDAAEADEGVQERYQELAHLLMSRPTETLQKEHKVCSTMLGAMEREIDRVQHGDVFDGEDFQLLVDFFEYYMEECHEPKEAQLLFNKMTERGVSEEGGLVAEMTGEHHDLGARLQAAEEHLPKAREGDLKSREAFFADLTAYIDGMRRHMKVEDEVLFPMIEHVLTQRELEELARAFESMESQAIADGVHEKYVDLARRLSIPTGTAAADA